VRSAKGILFGTDRRPGEGFGAGLWATWALSGFVAAIGGVAKGIWWAALFLIPAALMLFIALQRARERDT
jgi:hypothetical protein